MANLVSVPSTTGDFMTAGTWYQTSAAPGFTSGTNVNVQASTATNDAWTAPNTTNAITGVLCFLVGVSDGLNITLKESGVSVTTWSVPLAQLRAGWNFIKFATPYTYTTTAANAYQMTFARQGAATITFVAGTTITNVYAPAIDDRTSATPGTADNVFIIAPNGDNTQAPVVTIASTTPVIGNGNSAGTFTNKSLNGLQIGAFGTLKASRTTTSYLNNKGHIYVEKDGVLDYGTVASPIPSTVLATIDTNSTTDGGFGVGVAGANAGQIWLQGTGYTGMNVGFVSGTGIAADPMITAADIGNVGDKVMLTAADNTATNYLNTEQRFIITKNSTTSYVLSNTKAGVEAALTKTHTSGLVVNVSSNVLITSSTTSWWFQNNSSTAGNVVLGFCQFNNSGSSQGTREGAKMDIGGNVTANNMSISNPAGRGFEFSSQGTATYSNLVVYGGASSTSTQLGGFYVTGSNKTFVDCAAIGYFRTGLYLNSTNNVFTRFIANANNTAAANATEAGVNIITASNNTFDTPRINANRARGIRMATGTDNVFTNGSIGNIGTNVIDIDLAGASYDQAVFTNCTFGSATFVNNYLNLLGGSVIKFHQLNGTTNNHRWYTKYGSAQSTGSGLTDTLVRTSGSLAVRLAPESTSPGFSWTENIIAKANSQVGFPIQLQRNATLGSSTVTASLTLPGNTSGTPDATYTLPTTTGAWLPVYLTAFYSGTTPGLATITINAQTTTAGAYLYADDAFVAGDGVSTTIDPVGGFDVWSNGQPVSIISPLQPISADIANSILKATTAGYTAGTVGNKIDSSLSTGKFIALK